MASNGTTTVIRNGTLIDATGNPAGPNEAVVIEGNRIRSVGGLPPDVNLEDREVNVIDAAGRWIMPGLIDVHCHLSFGNPPMPGVPSAKGTTSAEFSTLRAARNLGRILAAGVTSVASPGGTWFIDVALRDAVGAGLIQGPRINCAGRFIATYGSILDNEPSWAGSPEHALAKLCNSVDEMITEVRRECKHGVNFIKLADSQFGDTQTISKRELEAVVGEAHRRNVPVTIHSRGSGSTRDAAQAGVDWILHADLATEADLDAVAEAGCRIVPTSTALHLALDMGLESGRSQSELDLVRRHIEAQGFVMQRSRELGVKVLCGTDTGNSMNMRYGVSHGNEPEILVKEGGYTPMEAIQSITKENAYVMGLDSQVGTIEEGRLADIILLDADPIADISVLKAGKHVTMVMKDGAVLDLDSLSPNNEPLGFNQVGF
jgi:imidazolonepropionase-like amidohydrolase